MIGNYAVSNLPVSSPQVQDVLWVNVAFGDDGTGQRNDPAHPFKTLNAALAASPSGSQDTYIIFPTGNTGAAYSLTSGDFTVSKPAQFIQQMMGPDTAPACLNTTCTITNNTRGNVFFDNVEFYNYASDKVCVDIQKVTDHLVAFRSCYFYNGVGNKNVITTSGTWDNTTQAITRLLFDSCSFGGHIIHSAGTVGSPFDMKGQMTIRNHWKNIQTAAADLTVNSGSVQVVDCNNMFPMIVNGGALEVLNCRDFSHLTSDGYIIKANDVDTVGKSFVTIRNFCGYNLNRAPSDTAIPKIKIGAKVIYSLQNVILPAANIEIDGTAVELNAYLTGLSKANFVTFNSGQVYGAGALLT